jgi:hypothetical protein
LINDLSQKIQKLPKYLKQNVNWNQTLLNEGEVILSPSISFLSIEVENVDCHSSGCLSQKKKKLKKGQNGTRVQSAVRTLENYDVFPIFSHKPSDSFLPNITSQPGKRYHPGISKELEVVNNFNPDELIPQSPHVILWGFCTSI